MSVLTTKYRPRKFSQVVGQNLAVKLLKSAALNPAKSPRVFLLYGQYGTGKSSIARLFGRALSCENFEKLGDICGKCSGCLSFDQLNDKYIEFDSSIIGNIKSIQDLRNVFDQVTDFYRVIVFDEIQIASSKAQSALLKTIEEGSFNTFYIMATTDIDKVLKTIQSRSLPVEFFQVDNLLMVEHLKNICSQEKVENISNDILEKIALKADGHVRDALMVLSGYLISYDEELVKLPVDDIKEFFQYISIQAVDQARLKIPIIMKNPVSQIKKSLCFVIMKIMEDFSLGTDSGYKSISDKLGGNTVKIFKFISEPWVQEAFKDEYLCISFFYTLLKLISSGNKI